MTLLEQISEIKSSLSGEKLEALNNFLAKGFPTKKEEAWKYTSLNSILNIDYDILPKKQTNIEGEQVKKYFLNEIETYKIVFLNGEFVSHLSSITQEGLHICTLSSALSDAKYQAVVNKYFGKTVNKQDSLTNLNIAYTSEGVYIHIPKSVVVEKPIEIIYLSEGNNALFLQPRNLIVVGENAQVQIIERHQCLSEATVFTNGVTEIFADKRAIVDYYKIQNDAPNANLVDNTYIEQQEESRASVHTFSFGGNITRNNLNFYQKGERIDSTLKGVTIIGNKQHIDHYTLVNHEQPNCESHQNYKGIFDDRATGVFNGKIYVDKIAQKTDAFQQNNNILLTDKATLNTKPQLEIFADDVKCSHGCTIGQLDESAMFYMQQRGIPKKEAKALLMYAFTHEVLESIKIPILQKKLQEIISQKLGVNIGFEASSFEN